MDEIKTKNFEALYPGKPLPKFRHLSQAECQMLLTTLAAKVGLLSEASGLETLQALEKRSEDIPGVRPTDEGFVLSSLFTQLQLEPSTVYINWSRFEDIDEMPASELSAAFNDLWYPSSDDIEIFDREQKWVLMIRHFDVAQFVRL